MYNRYLLGILQAGSTIGAAAAAVLAAVEPAAVAAAKQAKETAFCQ